TYEPPAVGRIDEAKAMREAVRAGVARRIGKCLAFFATLKLEPAFRGGKGQAMRGAAPRTRWRYRRVSALERILFLGIRKRSRHLPTPAKITPPEARPRS